MIQSRRKIDHTERVEAEKAKDYSNHYRLFHVRLTCRIFSVTTLHPESAEAAFVWNRAESEYKILNSNRLYLSSCHFSELFQSLPSTRSPWRFDFYLAYPMAFSWHLQTVKLIPRRMYNNIYINRGKKDGFDKINRWCEFTYVIFSHFGILIIFIFMTHFDHRIFPFHWLETLVIVPGVLRFVFELLTEVSDSFVLVSVGSAVLGLTRFALYVKERIYIVKSAYWSYDTRSKVQPAAVCYTMVMESLPCRS